MIEIKMDTESFQQMQQLIATMPDKARFAASVGLNRTANEIQDAIRQRLPASFRLRRRTFIEQTIYRQPGEDFATKDRLVAGVRIHPDRNVLAKFEDGGLKRAEGSGYVAVPLGARPNPSAVVPEKFRLRSLFFNQQSLLAQAAAVYRGRKASSRKLLVKRSAANDVFVRAGIVFQRLRSGLKALWVFKRHTKLPASLQFVATGRRVGDARLSPNILGAIDVELSRGLNTKNGPTTP